jgi:hypothetical protein
VPLRINRTSGTKNKSNAVNGAALQRFRVGFLRDERASALTFRALTHPRPMKPEKPCSGMKQAVPIWLDR